MFRPGWRWPLRRTLFPDLIGIGCLHPFNTGNFTRGSVSAYEGIQQFAKLQYSASKTRFHWFVLLPSRTYCSPNKSQLNLLQEDLSQIILVSTGKVNSTPSLHHGNTDQPKLPEMQRLLLVTWLIKVSVKRWSDLRSASFICFRPRENCRLRL
jgi:hypothetical protein